MSLCKTLKRKLSKVKLISLDVDGVLTDGKQTWGISGVISLNFNVKDGTAIQEMQNLGYTIVIISATNSGVIQTRMKHLGIDNVHVGITDKEQLLSHLMIDLDLTQENILHIADDRNDIKALNFAGLAFCPADAIESVKLNCDAVLNTRGGQGVCVELLDYLCSSNDDHLSIECD